MIFKFEKDGYQIVLDINSGSIHVVDPLIYQLIDDYPNPEEEKLIDRYKDHPEYDEQIVKLGLKEINQLIEKNLLFLKNRKNPTSSIMLLRHCVFTSHMIVIFVVNIVLQLKETSRVITF